MKAPTRTDVGVAILLAVGLVRIAAEAVGLAPLSGLAAAWGASPAPKVFSAVRGLETFSSRFVVSYRKASGETDEVVLSPDQTGRLLGPYNRRNVYGAVLAYGPVLLADSRTVPMFESVARYALCGKAPLLSEIGLDPGATGPVTIRLEPDAATEPDPALRLTLAAPCP